MDIKSEISVQNARGKDARKATRVYFWHEGESILENFGNRVARPTDVYRKFLPEVSKALGLPEDTPYRWSQYAGCSCPCSPGFICSDSTGKLVSVELSGAPNTSDNPKQLAEAWNRELQLANQLSREEEFAKKSKPTN